MKRESLGSRLGFILLSAGCAIGIGNVWKFPYVAGQNGGAIFLFFYLLFLLVIGIPVLVMEFSTGRSAQVSPVKMFGKLKPKVKLWGLQGKIGLAGNYLLMAFYTTVTGWMLRYFAEAVTGAYMSLDSAGIQQHFQTVLADPGSVVFYMGLTVLIGFGVCAAGLQNGLEKITKWMMGVLLVAMVVLAVNSLFQPGGMEGLKYFLMPNWDAFLEIGPAKVICAAMSQAFFTLSLGIGGMAIFGSYIGKENTLLSESVRVAGLDTFVAITAGLIIIPSCFAYNIELNAGPSLIFITLPNIFNNMPFGQLWAALFFLFISFAALSTVFAVFEGILACFMDLTGWTRKQACLANIVIVFLISLPCALGFNILSAVQPLGAGSTILDLEDLIVSGFLLPLGSFGFVLFCTWDFGWGWRKFRKEANTGKGLEMPDWIHPYCKYILPMIILAVFLIGLIGF
ncbi:MAG: sodium-dependent transporter [Erysipelotrichaceae bacterium]|nr:sodium-dependent transporter [Erysipelotrichaceae bacterium]